MTNLVDAHHHLWDLRAVSYPWLSARGELRFFGDPTPIQRDYLFPEYRDEAAQCGIAGSVHIQVGAADPVAEAVWVDNLARDLQDWPLVQVPYCDLTSPDLGERLDYLQSLVSVRGVRQIVGRAPGEDAATGTNSLLDDPRLQEGLIELGRRGLSFDLQLVPTLMSKAAEVLAQAPETRVALCHAGSPLDRSAGGLKAWTEGLERLADLPQVFCKISGLGMFDHLWSASSIAPIVETSLARFGVDRCMFGSNFPVDKLYSDYATLFQALRSIVPKAARNRFFGEVAQDFYRLNFNNRQAHGISLQNKGSARMD
jgi:predicted TIM-barrel fold metal-dependent hydrolase